MQQKLFPFGLFMKKLDAVSKKGGGEKPVFRESVRRVKRWQNTMMQEEMILGKSFPRKFQPENSRK